MRLSFVIRTDNVPRARFYTDGSVGIFNLGGDLALFLLLIKSGERDALAHYARLCIDNIYPRIRNYFSPGMTTSTFTVSSPCGRTSAV